MKVCPKCHALAVFNIYFGAFICTENGCDWKDDTYNENRIKKYNLLVKIRSQKMEDIELSARECF